MYDKAEWSTEPENHAHVVITFLTVFHTQHNSPTPTLAPPINDPPAQAQATAIRRVAMCSKRTATSYTILYIVTSHLRECKTGANTLFFQLSSVLVPPGAKSLLRAPPGGSTRC